MEILQSPCKKPTWIQVTQGGAGLRQQSFVKPFGTEGWPVTQRYGRLALQVDHISYEVCTTPQYDNCTTMPLGGWAAPTMALSFCAHTLTMLLGRQAVFE